MMATGYTSVLTDREVSFREFVLRCARGMGAGIHMRDEPLDVHLRKDEVSSYYILQVEKLEAKLVKWSTMTEDEIKEECLKELRDCKEAFEENKRKELEYDRRISSMIKKVEKWNPPTGEHEGLKVFMLSQLAGSRPRLEFSSGGYSENLDDVDFVEYLNKKLKDMKKDIAYYRTHIREESERVAACNRWIDELYNNLESYNEGENV